MSHIKIRTFTGGAIKPYIPSIAKLRMEIFHDYPFLYEGDIDFETRYLKKYAQCKDAIAVLVFDGAKIVGASTGLPFEDELPEFKKPFIDAGLPIPECFHFGESVLKKEYRGRGIGHHLFDHREEHVKHLKRFKRICFCTVASHKDHPKRPHDYLPLDNFWKKRGYTQHPELKCLVDRKEIGENDTAPKPLTFWIKEL